MKKKMLLLVTITVQLLIGIMAFRNVAKAQTVPTFGVEPEYFVQAPYLNETFHVNVTLKDLDESYKLVGVQFRLKYNDTVLEVVDVVEGSFLQDPRWNLYGTFWVYYIENDGLYGPHIVAGNMIYPNHTNGEWDQTQFPEGSGVIATITFKVLSLPLEPNSFFLCSLEFVEAETILFDGEGNNIPYNVQNGRVTITSSQFLTVNPSLYYASSRGELFNVTIEVNGIDQRWHLIGVQFRLTYDPKLLEVVDVVEGSFLQDPRWNLYGTFWVYYIENDGLYGPHIVAGNMIYPNHTNGEWDQTQFPEGSGVIATITFKVIQGPPSAASFELIDTQLFDPEGNDIPYNLQGGQYVFSVEKLYHNILWDTQLYIVITESNVTINPVPMYFDQPHRMLHFNVTGPEGTLANCSIAIPKTLLYASSDQWLLIVGGEISEYQVTEDETYTYLYFSCPLSAKTVYIIGTEVIPEFPTLLILGVFVVAMIFIVASKSYARTQNWREL